MSRKSFFRYIILFIFISIFLGIKLANNSINFFTDTETYFYTGYKLLHGQRLYTDIFFTNLPLFPYISALYFLLTRGNIYAYYFTSSIEATLVAILIYKIIYRETSDYLSSTISALLYLFSLVTLFITKGQSGIITASLFLVITYYFLLKKKYLLSGIFLSVCFLTKGYFIVVIPAFFLKVFILKDREKYYFYIGFLVLTSLVFLPFTFTSFKEIFAETVKFYVSKGAGIPKETILQYVFTYDPLLFLLFVYNILRIKKNLFFGTLCLFFLFYFIFSSGVYYLYLSMIVPFLCISYPSFYYSIQKRLQYQKYVLEPFVLVYILYVSLVYLLSFSSSNKVNYFSEMINIVKKEKPSYLYGVSGLSAILAYETGTPLLENIIDTNEDLYKNNIYDGRKLTKKAIQQKAMLISVGRFYPQQSIRENIVNISIDKTLAEKSCHYVKGFSENIDAGVNMINFYRCY